MAGSEPFEYLGSPATQALYVPFADLEPSFARQSERLSRLGSDAGAEIGGSGLRRLTTQRIAGRLAGQLATGTGLDEHIQLSALDRRSLIHQG
jgi:hypothetical protein